MRGLRLKFGDIVRYAKPGQKQPSTGCVIGHPPHTLDHDIVVLAPIPAAGQQWEILNDDWCQLPHGKDLPLAVSERRRLRKRRSQLLERLPPGWTR